MGITLNTTSTYFRMSVPPNQYYGYFHFADYTNDTGQNAVLQSITLYLGSGNGTFTAGVTATGNGGAFGFRVYVNGSSSNTYSDVTITNSMNVSSGGYPITANCQPYTFNFQNAVTLAPNQSVQLWWQTLDTSDTKVLCFDINRYSASTRVPAYTVTFNLDGGTRTGGGELVQQVTPGGNATPPTCSKTGYTFSGWNGSYTNITSDRTITALWTANTYTIEYNANGGSGAPGNQTKVYGQNLNLSNTVPTKSYTVTFNPNSGSVSPTSKVVNCTFVHWNTRADGTGTSYASGATYTNNASVTLYAIYSNNAIGDLPTPIRTNCKFDCWTTTLNGSSQVTTDTIISSNTTIYAKWTYNVVLNGNGGTIYVPDEGEALETYTLDKKHGEDLTIPNYSVFYDNDPQGNPQGRNFLGWGTSSSGSVVYPPNGIYTTDAPITLYAIYGVETFTVTFEDGFGNVVQVYNNVPFGGSVTPPTAEYMQQNYAKPGYTFTGWLGNYTNVISNTTVYALYGFVPIWIYVNDSGTRHWVKYEPEER